MDVKNTTILHIAQCGAKTRSGGECKNKAGKGTDHPGQGRCKFHGGSTPIKTGRYSKIQRPRIKELIEGFENDPDPFDLLPEVKLLRALILDYIERYDEYTDALLEWHDSYVDSAKAAFSKPTKIMDIISVGTFIGQIGSLLEKIHKQKQESTISIATLNRIIEQLGIEAERAIAGVIEDADMRSKVLNDIESRWQSIRIEPNSASN